MCSAPLSIAYREQQVNMFFKRASHLLFLIFPNPEEGIHIQPSFLDDPDYEEHIMTAHCKVSHWLLVSTCGLLVASSFSRGGCVGHLASFWGMVKKISPLKHCMDLEWKWHGWGRWIWLFRRFMSTMPTPTWADKTFQKVERLVAGLEVGCWSVGAPKPLCGRMKVQQQETETGCIPQIKKWKVKTRSEERGSTKGETDLVLNGVQPLCKCMHYLNCLDVNVWKCALRGWCVNALSSRLYACPW